MRDPAKALMLLLRVGGCVMLLAALAIIMPTSWMVLVHRWLGLGAFPHSALVEYLTRSISALYAFHGGLLLMVSLDIPRFAPVVRYLGVATLATGFILLVIDIYADLPWIWILIEGPMVMLVGILIIGLLQASERR